jgi:hypothetical protein
MVGGKEKAGFGLPSFVFITFKDAIDKNYKTR